MAYPGDESVSNALEDDYQLLEGDRMMEKAHKECGLIVRYSGPNGGTRTHCKKDRGHKGECSG